MKTSEDIRKEHEIEMATKWDYILIKTPTNEEDILEIENEIPFQRTHFHDVVKSLFPSSDINERTTVIINGNDCFEVTADEEELYGIFITVHVLESESKTLKQLCDALECRVIDIREKQILSFSASAAMN